MSKKRKPNRDTLFHLDHNPMLKQTPSSKSATRSTPPQRVAKRGIARRSTRISKRTKRLIDMLSDDLIDLILSTAACDLHDLATISCVCKSWNTRLHVRRRNVRQAYFRLCTTDIAKSLCYCIASPSSTDEKSKAYLTECLAGSSFRTLPAFDLYFELVEAVFMYMPRFLRQILPDRDHESREQTNCYARTVMMATYTTFLRNHSSTAEELARMLCNWACGGEADNSSDFFEVVVGDVVELSFLKEIIEKLFEYLRDLVRRLGEEESI